MLVGLEGQRWKWEFLFRSEIFPLFQTPSCYRTPEGNIIRIIERNQSPCLFWNLCIRQNIDVFLSFNTVCLNRCCRKSGQPELHGWGCNGQGRSRSLILLSIRNTNCESEHEVSSLYRFSASLWIVLQCLHPRCDPSQQECPKNFDICHVSPSYTALVSRLFSREVFSRGRCLKSIISFWLNHCLMSTAVRELPSKFGDPENFSASHTGQVFVDFP